MNQNSIQADYRINYKDNQNISIEIKCCGAHIGEIRFMDKQFKDCPACGTRHMLRTGHNHFHLTKYAPEEKQQ